MSMVSTLLDACVLIQSGVLWWRDGGVWCGTRCAYASYVGRANVTAVVIGGARASSTDAPVVVLRLRWAAQRNPHYID